ncbi:MAG: ATP-binding protein [Phycisphaerae bacterium]
MMTMPEQFGIRESDLTEMVVQNDLRAVKIPEDRIMSLLERAGYDGDTLFAIKLALEEALTNAVKHGNKNDRAKRVVVRYHIDPSRVVVAIRDQGNGFRPTAVPDPTAEENLERPNGRGIMLMQAYMTRVQYNEAGNEVWMLKENLCRQDCPPTPSSPT